MTKAGVECVFVDEPRFVWARFSGRWTMSTNSEHVDRIVAECQARKQDLLLIDFLGVENERISLAARFRLGVSVLSFAGRLRKVAVVLAERLLDPQRFGEQVARNRGVDVHVFSDPDEARQWLLKEK